MSTPFAADSLIYVPLHHATWPCMQYFHDDLREASVVESDSCANFEYPPTSGGASIAIF
jgi:hypothetical protein